MTRETHDGPEARLQCSIERARELCQVEAAWWGHGSVPYRAARGALDKLLAYQARAQADQNEHGVDEERRLARGGSILEDGP